MAGVLCNAGESIVLAAALNKTAGQDLVLRLFATNVTPAETDVASTYTEAAGGNYAALTLSGATWTIGGGAPSSASYATVTFSFNGALTTNGTIYGYYMTQLTSGTLFAAEAGAGLQFTPANNGDLYKVTPHITCD